MSDLRSPIVTVSQPIPQEAFDWYDEYAHGLIDRRTFLDRLSTLSTAGFTLGVLSVIPERERFWLMNGTDLFQRYLFDWSQAECSFTAANSVNGATLQGATSQASKRSGVDRGGVFGLIGLHRGRKCIASELSRPLRVPERPSA